MGIQIEAAWARKLDGEAIRYAEKAAQAAMAKAEEEARRNAPEIDPLDYQARDIESARIEFARQAARERTYGKAVQEFEEQERQTGALWKEVLAEHQDQINSDVIR